MDTIAFQGLIGLSMAMYLWLISAGLTIIFGVLRIVNFAHGSLFMVGAYLAYTFYGLMGLPFPLAIFLSLLGTGLLGRGDELIRIIVETPRKLSARQRELLEEFARISGEEVHPLSKSFLEKVKSMLG